MVRKWYMLFLSWIFYIRVPKSFWLGFENTYMNFMGHLPYSSSREIADSSFTDIPHQLKDEAILNLKKYGSEKWNKDYQPECKWSQTWVNNTEVGWRWLTENLAFSQNKLYLSTNIPSLKISGKFLKRKELIGHTGRLMKLSLYWIIMVTQIKECLMRCLANSDASS